MTLNPKESGKLIAKLANHVFIKEEGIKILGEKMIENVLNGKINIRNFSQQNIHPSSTSPNVIDWLFVVDNLNYCFWHNDHEQGWVVDGHSGYFALCAAMNRAVKEGVDILNPTFYSTIDKDQLLHVLRSDTNVQIPLIDERLKCLHSAGKTLIDKFNGTFKNCVEQAENSAVKLLEIITNNFECFRDEADYKGHRVSLYKRAQILVGDVWSCFKGKGLGHFDDINEITMFPDYRVPQSLLYYGVFKYSEELLNLLRSNMLLNNGSEMEVEIRGCSIHAVTLLTEYVNERVKSDEMINAILVDHFLWDYRRKRAKEISKKNLPFHKTFCIYY